MECSFHELQTRWLTYIFNSEMTNRASKWIHESKQCMTIIFEFEILSNCLFFIKLLEFYILMTIETIGEASCSLLSLLGNPTGTELWLGLRLSKADFYVLWLIRESRSRFFFWYKNVCALFGSSLWVLFRKINTSRWLGFPVEEPIVCCSKNSLPDKSWYGRDTFINQI